MCTYAHARAFQGDIVVGSQTVTSRTTAPLAGSESSAAAAATSEAQHLEQIAKAADSLESRFLVKGSSPPPAGSEITVTVLNHSDSPHTIRLPVSRREVASGAIEAMLTAAQPSPFGMGSETVVDPSVRRAEQIMADGVRITGLPLGDILEQVRVG
jgi:hypothetical protein